MLMSMSLIASCYLLYAQYVQGDHLSAKSGNVNAFDIFEEI